MWRRPGRRRRRPRYRSQGRDDPWPGAARTGDRHQRHDTMTISLLCSGRSDRSGTRCRENPWDYADADEPQSPLLLTAITFTGAMNGFDDCCQFGDEGGSVCADV